MCKRAFEIKTVAKITSIFMAIFNQLCHKPHQYQTHIKQTGINDLYSYIFKKLTIKHRTASIKLG